MWCNFTPVNFELKKDKLLGTFDQLYFCCSICNYVPQLLFLTPVSKYMRNMRFPMWRCCKSSYNFAVEHLEFNDMIIISLIIDQILFLVERQFSLYSFLPIN